MTETSSGRRSGCPRRSLVPLVTLGFLVGLGGCADGLLAGSDPNSSDDELFRFAEAAYTTTVDAACQELNEICQTMGKCQAFQLFCSPSRDWSCLTQRPQPRLRAIRPQGR